MTAEYSIEKGARQTDAYETLLCYVRYTIGLYKEISMSYDKAKVKKMAEAIESHLEQAEYRVTFLETYIIPIWNQQKAMSRFGRSVGLMAKDVHNALAVFAGELLIAPDADQEPLFKDFILCSDQTPEKLISDQSAWQLFLTDSEAFLYELPKVAHICESMLDKRTLAFEVSKYQMPLNHIDKLSKALARMKQISGLYAKAVGTDEKDEVQQDELTLKEEFEDCLEWCRFDDYEKQLTREKRSASRKQKKFAK